MDPFTILLLQAHLDGAEAHRLGKRIHCNPWNSVNVDLADAWDRGYWRAANVDKYGDGAGYTRPPALVGVTTEGGERDQP